jgi:hypothetical protein
MLTDIAFCQLNIECRQNTGDCYQRAAVSKVASGTNAVKIVMLKSQQSYMLQLEEEDPNIPSTESKRRKCRVLYVWVHISVWFEEPFRPK